MDSVLNLSAFGEVIPGKKQDSEDITFGSFMKDKGKEAHVTENVANFIAYKSLFHSSQIKLFHWQTKSYSEHKALDKAFGNLVDLTDELMECTMGKYGRPVLDKQHTVILENYSDSSSATESLQSMRKCYCDELRPMLSPEKDSELLNLVDEIIAMFDKTMYLLTLK
jgi:hypothetical protein